MKRLLGILFFIVLTALPVRSAVYYVAPTGGSDSNPGTEAQPWATWQKAFDTAIAGDTVYFRGGVWYLQQGQTVDLVNKDGTASNYIHFFNYPGEAPILDGTNITPEQPAVGQFTYSGGLYIDGSNYIHWRGLTIRNFNMVYDRVFVQGIVATNSNFQIFENITVHGIEGRGIYYSPWYAPDSTYFINVDVYDCGDVRPLNDELGGWGDGWNAGVEEGGYMLFDGCRAWACSDDGFNIWGAGLIEMKNCWSFANGLMEGDGSGFKLNPTEDTTLTDLTRYMINNIAAFNAGNTGCGFNENNLGNVSLTCKIYNNTAYRNNLGFMTGGNLTGPYKVNDYRNNASYASRIGYEVDYNDWAGGQMYYDISNTWTDGVSFTVSDADFVLVDSAQCVTQMSASRKADGSLPDITALKLVPGSDLVDAGVNVGLPYFGSAPDIGYSEYAPIIADHTVVDLYDDIPQQWIDSVKKMLVWVPGMSHSLGYQNGVNLLEAYNATYQATTWSSDPPPAYSESYLRLGRPYMSSINFWLEDVGDYCSVIDGQNDGGNPFTVVINGWSYETTWNNAPGGGLDSVFDVHWAGDANGRWGLDAGDQALTGNATCMDTYLTAIGTYNNYFDTNEIPTIAVFSTGPVDDNAGTENGFQRELKNAHIREYVAADNSRILFDYADILVHNNSGVRYQSAWNDDGTDRPHDQIHPDNALDYDGSWNVVNENDADGDHIGEVGALRLGKAMWWMLARIAGWDGMTTSAVAVDSTATDILNFTLPQQTGAATINTSDHTVTIEIASGTDLTNLAPSITVSEGATISPASLTARDFTNPLTYTVTALDGTTTQVWTVTVTTASAPPGPGTAKSATYGNRWVVHGNKIVITE